MKNKEILEIILKTSTKPSPYEPGELNFWDDPHISKSMFEAHLSQEHDAASRRMEVINGTVKHLLNSSILKPGMKLLDLGCGPGLYAEKFSKAGIKVTGIDISQRSLEYAIRHAKSSGLSIEYMLRNFFEMNFENEFDAIIQVYGELCTFSDEKRDKLLSLIRKALKPNGVFIFDVSTRASRLKNGCSNSWGIKREGFWNSNEHLVLEATFDYSEEDLWLDQYVVISTDECKVYRNWFHDYSLESITAVLEKAGFIVKSSWNDLTGSTYEAGGDWIAISAIKN